MSSILALRLSSMCAACVLLLSVSACGKARSIESYCATFYEQGELFRDGAQQANQSGDTLAVLGELVNAPGQLAEFFDELDEVAPDEIEPDVAQLRDAFTDAANSMQSAQEVDIFSATAQGFMFGLRVYQSATRVDSYTLNKCGPPPTR